MSVNEKGWGLVVGECSKGMGGKAGIPQSSFRGLCGSVESFKQCMAVPLSHGHPLNDSNGVQRERGGGGGRPKSREAIFNLQSQSGKLWLLRNTEQVWTLF